MEGRVFGKVAKNLAVFPKISGNTVGTVVNCITSVTRLVGCPDNAKSLKSQAPQGFSGCLDIDNDEMNKKIFLSASPRVN